MSKIYVKLKSDNRYLEIECDKGELKIGEEILVESKSGGGEIAYVVLEQMLREESDKIDGTETKSDEAEYVFIRKLSEKDREAADKLALEAKSYLAECQNKINKYNLPMQLLDAELSFDEKKLTFFFTAPSRVDFRMLVSDLAHTFKKIIRLQQVGARDEARYLGGIGRCGQTLCCRRFLKGNLESVTLDMAADQSLAQMGSNRVTGVCGKLICCLKYELDEYREIKKLMPKLGEKIKTKEGEGVVVSHNVLKKSYTIKIDDSHNFVEINC